MDRLWRARGRHRARYGRGAKAELAAAKALLAALEADRDAVARARDQLACDNAVLMQDALRAAVERDSARTGCLFLLLLLVRAHNQLGRQQRAALAAAAARGWTEDVPAPIDRHATEKTVETPVVDLGDGPPTPVRGTPRPYAVLPLHQAPPAARGVAAITGEA
ncbi:hypothetical protein GCM10009802_03050 [Streptomyces synnematoformans]|uniref:Uncharacterized protein n=2 Tax=Streptomyces synnematoformans TaxID=415721 RepID=A0ABN2X9G7_9ACTN